MLIKINDKYVIKEKIGNGEFGNIYLGINELSNENVAIKIDSSDNILIKNEAKIYNILCNIDGIPKIKSYGKICKYNYLIIDLLGKSLEYYKEKSEGVSLIKIKDLGIQMVKIINKVHNLNIIHRDIKPENLMFGINENKELLYLIDFGLSKLYKQKNRHIKETKNNNIVGTLNYVSINIHKGVNASRRDDLESIIYILIELCIGKLPWDKIEKKEKIQEIKEKIDYKKLKIPNEIIRILNYIKKLSFIENPNYNYILLELNNL